jgi:type I restriction enzyme R subunit
VLEALVEKYADSGIDTIEDIKVLTLDPFNRLGTAPELIQSFGGKPAYLTAVRELEAQLYG